MTSEDAFNYKKQSGNSAFMELYSKLGQWLKCFEAYDKKVHRWVDSDGNSFEYTTKSAESFGNDIKILYLKFIKLYPELESCVFVLKYSNKKVAAESLTEHYKQIVELIEVLEIRTEEFFQKIPCCNDSWKTVDNCFEDEDGYFNYIDNINCAEQVGAYAYTAGIKWKTHTLQSTLTRLHEKELEENNSTQAITCSDPSPAEQSNEEYLEKEKDFESMLEALPETIRQINPASHNSEIPPERRSTPLSLSRMARYWGGDMTVKKIRSLINNGRLSVIQLNRQSYIFDTKHLPKHVIQKVSK